LAASASAERSSWGGSSALDGFILYPNFLSFDGGNGKDALVFYDVTAYQG
jgi:hypothetical protein